MRSAPSCWKSGGRRVSSISSPAASSRWPRKPPASPRCCCEWRRRRGPTLTVLAAGAVADRKTLGGTARWCDRLTPPVALDPPHGLFPDITGCAHLFGGERALLQIVSGALTRRGFAVSAAIASTSI